MTLAGAVGVLPLLAGCGGQQPLLVISDAVEIPEETGWSLEPGVEASDVRLQVDGLPPGARWSEAEGRLDFTPDFTQGGKSWAITFTAWSDDVSESHVLVLTVLDTIQPPLPEILSVSSESEHTLYEVVQTTDEWLEAPGWAGRSFQALITVPHGGLAPRSLPVVVSLHGLQAELENQGGNDRIRISPHDPEASTWWGYAEGLPEGAATGDNLPFTQRRVLHLLAWVLDNWPQADPARVILKGGSMGGAGALCLGLLHTRHFAGVSSVRSQSAPSFHAPTRKEELEAIWGTEAEGLDDGTGRSAWDTLDMGRALLEQPDAQDQWLFLRHGKDDQIIHYGTVTAPSPLVGSGFYERLQDLGVGHYVVWDEASHGGDDPILGADWWDRSWDPMALLRADQSFPAFSGSSLDEDPGDGTPNGLQDWDEDFGYAGQSDVAGDSGWSGDLAGALNRFLRWNSEALVDSWDEWEVPLMAIAGEGEPAPTEAYPTLGDLRDATTIVEVDVTPRRIQHFRLLEGEQVSWRFGDQEGSVLAGPSGVLTVPGLQVDDSWQVLALERLP